MMTVCPEPVATLEIGGRHLPPRMVANRFRADLPRPVPLSAMPPRRRLRLAMLLLMLAVPLVSATRHRHPA
jgi:hypothetical protein